MCSSDVVGGGRRGICVGVGVCVCVGCVCVRDRKDGKERECVLVCAI